MVVVLEDGDGTPAWETCAEWLRQRWRAGSAQRQHYCRLRWMSLVQTHLTGAGQHRRAENLYCDTFSFLMRSTQPSATLLTRLFLYPG
jgi:hypothetical protein